MIALIGFTDQTGLKMAVAQVRLLKKHEAIALGRGWAESGRLPRLLFCLLSRTRLQYRRYS